MEEGDREEGVSGVLWPDPEMTLSCPPTFPWPESKPQPSGKVSWGIAAYLYIQGEIKWPLPYKCFSLPPLGQETLEGTSHVP